MDLARMGGYAHNRRFPRSSSSSARAGTTTSRGRQRWLNATRRSRRPALPPRRPSNASSGATEKSTRRSSTRRKAESQSSWTVFPANGRERLRLGGRRDGVAGGPHPREQLLLDRVADR